MATNGKEWKSPKAKKYIIEEQILDELRKISEKLDRILGKVTDKSEVSGKGRKISM